MEDFQRLMYTRKFHSSFSENSKEQFQAFFERLAKHVYGSDFEIITPHGGQGDLKSDGRMISTGTIFQCYAPLTFNQSRFKRKIQTDFDGAKENWGEWMRKWVFVCNQEGFTPEVAKLFDKIREDHPSIVIEGWIKHDLFELFKQLDEKSLLDIFGTVQTFEEYRRIGYRDLEPVIEAIKLSEPVPDASYLTVPSWKKFEKNQLSEEAKDLLKIGRLKSNLVREYFLQGQDLEKGEQIAKSVHDHYVYFKGLDLPSDSIFWYLQRYIGYGGEPKEQGAQLAVLTHFFDNCDIFENPEEEG